MSEYVVWYFPHNAAASTRILAAFQRCERSRSEGNNWTPNGDNSFEDYDFVVLHRLSIWPCCRAAGVRRTTPPPVHPRHIPGECLGGGLHPRAIHAQLHLSSPPVSISSISQATATSASSSLRVRTNMLRIGFSFPMASIGREENVTWQTSSQLRSKPWPESPHGRPDRRSKRHMQRPTSCGLELLSLIICFVAAFVDHTLRMREAALAETLRRQIELAWEVVTTRTVQLARQSCANDRCARITPDNLPCCSIVVRLSTTPHSMAAHGHQK